MVLNIEALGPKVLRGPPDPNQLPQSSLPPQRGNLPGTENGARHTWRASLGFALA